jgi:hypothetical protein
MINTNPNFSLDRFKQKTTYVWHCQKDKLPSKVFFNPLIAWKSSLRCPGTKGTKLWVVSYSSWQWHQEFDHGNTTWRDKQSLQSSNHFGEWVNFLLLKIWNLRLILRTPNMHSWHTRGDQRTHCLPHRHSPYTRRPRYVFSSILITNWFFIYVSSAAVSTSMYLY